MFRHRLGVIATLVLITAIASACSDDSTDTDAATAGASATEPPSSADSGPSLPGTGGGGMITFDGEEIDITSVTCTPQSGGFEVSTASDNGFRAIISQYSPSAASVQFFDASFVQWFPEGPDPASQENGGSFAVASTTYRNNADDRTVEASLTVDCP